MSRKQNDPYGSFKFQVEVTGLIVGGFSEVNGLDINIGVETIKEGGFNDGDIKLPSTVSYSNLTLKRGLIDVDQLWSWYSDAVQGKVVRKNGTISLLNSLNVRVAAWNFFQTWPAQWNGPSFDASAGTIATETFVLVPQKISRLY